jgi:monofunctional biosynthetic peptidoglycan transglycosylase
MTRRRRRRGRRPLRWLVLLSLAGLAVAAGGSALAVLVLGRVAPPTTAFMWRARRADPASGVACPRVDYRWVERRRIAPSLARAVVIAEDQRFLLHRGFDLHSIQRAVEEGASAGRLRGASTLTQQLAKNLFLWPGRSFVRKALEAWFTAWLEALLPKARILELYLNVVQFGPCVFGAEAASRHFFDRAAAELSPEQAALLATVLPNPSRLRAGDPGPYASRRAAEILALMQELEGSPHLRGL